MIATPESYLGVGLYTIAEAALFARIQSRTISRWLFGSGEGEPVLTPQLQNSGEKLITFLDFVQALAVREIRAKHRVPLQKIRQAVEFAKGKYGVEYPFAQKHKTFLFGQDVIIRIGESEDEKQYVQASGKHKGNLMLKEIVELYLLDLCFDPEKSYPSSYRAYRWDAYEVSMNPRVRFGEPLLPSCGYTAQALWEASQAEGSLKAAATAYGVTEEEVEVACRYYDHLLGKSAA